MWHALVVDLIHTNCILKVRAIDNLPLNSYLGRRSGKETKNYPFIWIKIQSLETPTNNLLPVLALLTETVKVISSFTVNPIFVEMESANLLVFQLIFLQQFTARKWNAS